MVAAPPSPPMLNRIFAECLVQPRSAVGATTLKENVLSVCGIISTIKLTLRIVPMKEKPPVNDSVNDPVGILKR